MDNKKIKKEDAIGALAKEKKPKSFLAALRDISFKGKKNTPRDLSINHDRYLHDEGL